MGIQDDIAQARRLAQTDRSREWVELAPRLARSTNDDALDALLLLFVAERWDSDPPARKALVDGKHPQTGSRLAENLEKWLADEDTNLLVAFAAEILAQRDERDAIPRLRASFDATPEDDYVLRASQIAALLALGEAMEDVARADYVEFEDQELLALVLRLAPDAYFDSYAPLLGSDVPKRLQPPILSTLLAAQRTLDSRWTELGNRLKSERPPPFLAHFIPRLTTSSEVAVGSDHPLSDVDEAFAAKHDLHNALVHNAHGWTLVTKAHSRADIVAIFAKLGTKLTGLSFRNRRIPAKHMSDIGVLANELRLGALDLSGNPLGVMGLRSLLARPFPKLTHLNLGHANLTAKAYELLSSTSSLPALRSLHLAREGDKPSKDFLTALVSGDALQLKELSLAHWRSLDFAELVDSRFFASLERLHVTTTFEIDPLLANLGELRELSFAGALRNYALVCRDVGPSKLERIVLDGCAVDPRTGGLFESTLFGTIRELSLERAYFGAFDKMLETDPPALRHLNLRHVNTINRAALERLANWPPTQRLEWLDVGGDTDLRAQDVEVLPESARDAVRRAGWPD